MQPLLDLCYHGKIDIAGIEFHVDLLVDERFAVLLEVLSDLGSHVDAVVVLVSAVTTVPSLE